MCISFFDLPLRRQEEITVETVHLAHDSPRWWEVRRDKFLEHLREKYAEMDTDTLTAHQAELEAEHGNDPDWAPVIDAVTHVLKERANAGAL